MLSMYKHYFLLGVTMLLLASCSSEEFSGAHCRCNATESPLQALRSYDAVFSGRVSSIRKINWYDYQATFQVKDAWKGVEEGKIPVDSTTFRTSCGYAFKLGESYLVYAYQHNGVLFAHHCSRTRPLENAQEDVTALGVPMKRFNPDD